MSHRASTVVCVLSFIAMIAMLYTMYAREQRPYMAIIDLPPELRRSHQPVLGESCTAAARSGDVGVIDRVTKGVMPSDAGGPRTLVQSPKRNFRAIKGDSTSPATGGADGWTTESESKATARPSATSAEGLRVRRSGMVPAVPAHGDSAEEAATFGRSQAVRHEPAKLARAGSIPAARSIQSGGSDANAAHGLPTATERRRLMGANWAFPISGSDFGGGGGSMAHVSHETVTADAISRTKAPRQIDPQPVAVGTERHGPTNDGEAARDHASAGTGQSELRSRSRYVESFFGEEREGVSRWTIPNAPILNVAMPDRVTPVMRPAFALSAMPQSSNRTVTHVTASALVTGGLTEKLPTTALDCRPAADMPLTAAAVANRAIAMRWLDQISTRYTSSQQWIADEYRQTLGRCDDAAIINAWLMDGAQEPTEWLCRQGFDSPLWSKVYTTAPTDYPNTGFRYGEVEVLFNGRYKVIPLDDPQWQVTAHVPPVDSECRKQCTFSFRAPCEIERSGPPVVTLFRVAKPGRIHPRLDKQ